jgi:hypothetical protein
LNFVSAIRDSSSHEVCGQISSMGFIARIVGEDFWLEVALVSVVETYWLDSSGSFNQG